MPVRPPLGESSFEILRSRGLTYVDKTPEVAALLADAAPAILITRPRRFGKTLLLTTLRAFVDRDAHGPDVFEGTAIADDVAAAAHRRRHPVVWLSFKEIKPADPAALLRAVAAELRFVLEDHALTDLPELRRLHDQLGDPTVEAVTSTIRRMTRALHRATGERCVVLIDEYDTPIHAAWVNGFYDEAIALLRPLLSGALKDNTSLEKAVMTGITRVAQEGLFSGLNNLTVASMLDDGYPTACGFTEPEVHALLRDAELADRLDDLRAWYDGYAIGGTRLYNPWSVLSFLRSPLRGFQTWWVQTGGDELLRSVLVTGDPNLHQGIAAILRGDAIERPLVEHLVLRDLPNADAIWTLLVHAGYLHVVASEPRGFARWAVLAPPNQETRAAWWRLFEDWLVQGMNGEEGVRRLTDALLQGHAAVVQDQLQTLALRHLSALDPGGKAPERVWHAFTLGILAHLSPTHRVPSELEAGFGRAHVVIAPLSGGAGAVLEFKRVGPGERPSDVLDAAMSQIDRQRYVDRLVEVGASPRWKVAVAFAGRDVAVRIDPG